MRARFAAALGLDAAAAEERFPLRTYVTTGDREQRGSLAAIGGKGLFVKEIELALLAGEAAIAVHSMKDLPAEMPEGLVTAAVPERDDPRDAFLAPGGARLGELPNGARIGTSSVRRAAQVLRQRPDLRVVEMRGNVQTRLRKLAAGEADGTFLAEAGLVRLGRADVVRHPLDPKDMLPALGQGALCVQARADDADAMTACRLIDHAQTALATAVERAFVARLDGSCRTPMAGLARVADGVMRFVAEILTLDGRRRMRRQRTIRIAGRNHAHCLLDAAAAGADAAEDMVEEAGPRLSAMLGR